MGRNRISIEPIEEVGEIGILRVDSLMLGEEIERTVSCLEKLESARKQVFVLHLRNVHSHGRISDAMKSPLGKIKSDARRGLYKCSYAWGFTPHSVRSLHFEMENYDEGLSVLTLL